MDTTTALRDIRRVFIANRGEIALRVIQACHRLGIEAVLGVSEADQHTVPAEAADQTVLLGPSPAPESYLQAAKIVNAALQTRCDAVHPGYGFLSERAHFVRACEEAGLAFIGPSAEAIEMMGDKISAVAIAEKAGVPRIPGTGALTDVGQARKAAAEIGYPVLIKASAGGGGRGMRVARDPADLEKQMVSAASEAQAAFGDPAIYLEKFVERARHVEIQVLADEFGHVIHLGERECSTQRRHQKLIEEAPSPAIDAETRAAMGEAAVNLARRAGYVGAGTVEFVVDADDSRKFCFLEMNTRIQVEHPVTEMITGIDLVAEQIRIASGLPLSVTQDDIALTGHAIECRINAEDPDKQFMPRPGIITRWDAPSGEGIRFDTHCKAGAEIPPYYDSLLGKLIVHAADRPTAIARMREALGRFVVEGIPTTAPFHTRVLAHDDFAAGQVTTRWVEDVFLPEEKAAKRARGEAEKAAAAAVAE
mgnify:FL=1